MATFNPIFIGIAKTFNGYDNTMKELFHNNAKRYLREIVRIMGLPKGSYEIRSNKAGIACLGEVTLHTDHLYVQFGGSLPNSQFYYRSCKSQKDYTGGINRWMDYDSLMDVERVASVFHAIQVGYGYVY